MKGIGTDKDQISALQFLFFGFHHNARVPAQKKQYLVTVMVMEGNFAGQTDPGKFVLALNCCFA